MYAIRSYYVRSTDLDGTAKIGHHTVNDGKPQPGAGSNFLGGIKGIKDMRGHIRRHARAVILYLHNCHRLFCGLEPKSYDSPCFGCGIQSIDHEVALV